MFWKLTLALGVIVSAAGVLYLGGVNKAQLTETLKYVERSASSSGPAPAMRHEVALPIKPKAHWDGLVAIDPAERTAIGLQLAKVEAQARPIKLELTGRTAYD